MDIQGSFFQLPNGESVCGKKSAISSLQDNEIERCRSEYIIDMFDGVDKLEYLSKILPRTKDDIIVHHQVDHIWIIDDNGINCELLNIHPNNSEYWWHQRYDYSLVDVISCYYYREEAIKGHEYGYDRSMAECLDRNP